MTRNKLGRAIHEFNQQRFFEAHESLEDIWREASGKEKTFLQALVQVCVAFHHFIQGNLVGAASLLAKSVQNFSSYPDDFSGIDLASLRHALLDWQQALASGEPPPPLPKLVPSKQADVQTAKRL